MKKLITLLLVLCAGVMNVSADVETWTVAGNNAVIFGASCDETYADNDMTYEN